MYVHFMQETEFSKSIGVKNLTLDDHEVLVIWKWTWDGSPPSPHDDLNKSRSPSPCGEDGESQDEGTCLSDLAATTHAIMHWIKQRSKISRDSDKDCKADG